MNTIKIILGLNFSYGTIIQYILYIGMLFRKENFL